MEEHALAQGNTFPWHELYVANADAAIDFYDKVLGMGSKAMDMGEMGTYKMLTVNGTAVCGIMETTNLPHPNVPPHWAVYLAVDDVDARLEKVRAHGGSVVVEPFDIPSVGRMALISDPQGAHIWLFKHEQPA